LGEYGGGGGGGGGGGPHLLQSSNGKVIEQVVAPRRVVSRRQIRFHRDPPFPQPPHNGNEHGDPSVKINVLYLRDLIRHQHSFPRRYSHRDVSIQTFFDKNNSLLKLSRNKFFSETNEYKL